MLEDVNTRVIGYIVLEGFIYCCARCFSFYLHIVLRISVQMHPAFTVSVVAFFI